MEDTKFSDLLGNPIGTQRLELLLGILEAEIRRQPDSNIAAARIDTLQTGHTKAILVLATGDAAHWLSTMLDHVAGVQHRRERAEASKAAGRAAKNGAEGPSIVN